MRFFTLFAGALVATTAANILLASEAYAGFPPNGWEQKGRFCRASYGPNADGNKYHKLRKKSDNSKFGVYRNEKSWVQKGITLKAVNAKMNEKCGCIHGGSCYLNED